jgi:hypothetical protein
MKRRNGKIVFALAPLMLFAARADLRAQPPTPRTYLAVLCVKTPPEHRIDFEQVIQGPMKKIAQARMDSKQLIGFTFSRAVAPAGQEARCDYVVVEASAGGYPPPARATDELLKKANVNMTAPAYYAKLYALSKLVTSDRMVGVDGFGPIEKGDFYQVNFMKPKPGKTGDFFKFERTVWMPLAKEAAKAGGTRKGWAVYSMLYPSGTGVPYDALTIDVFRDWDSVWKGAGFSKEVFEKVFPGKTQEELFEPMASVRDLVRRELYVVVDRLTAAPPAGASTGQ